MSYALLIDDDEALASGLQSLAADEGLELLTAATWNEGLEVFHATAPNLVIADYNLPESSHGLRLLLEIGRLRPSVRMLLVSAYLNEADVEQVMALGLVHRVLRKVDAMSTGRALLEEIRLAAEVSGKPTDWVAIGEANRRVSDVSEEAFERLDEFLRSHRLPDSSK